MVEPINLNKARKAREKAARAATAAANRAKHGRTHLQKALDAAEADLRARRLDQSRRDGRDED